MSTLSDSSRVHPTSISTFTTAYSTIVPNVPSSSVSFFSNPSLSTSDLTPAPSSISDEIIRVGSFLEKIRKKRNKKKKEQPKVCVGCDSKEELRFNTECNLYVCKNCDPDSSDTE